MPRTPPPSGLLSLSDAVKHLEARGIQITDAMIYKYAASGRLGRYGAEGRKQKYYSVKELDRLADEELGRSHIELTFSRASLEDLEGITALSAKVFKALRPISTETRRGWLLKEPRGHYVVKRPNGEILSYLHILALTDEHIEEYMAGRISGKQITSEDVQILQPGRPIACIVASVAGDPDIKAPLRKRCNSILLHGVALDIAMLGLQGIIVSRLYAWSESKDGILMCALMGMQQYQQPFRIAGRRRYTFYLDIPDSTLPLLRGYQRTLAQWQAVQRIAPVVATQKPTEAPAVIWQAVVPATSKKPPPMPKEDAQPLADGSVPLHFFAGLHGLNARTVGDQARKGVRGEKLQATEDENAPPGKNKWFLSPEQQRAAVAFWKEHHTPGFHDCDQCPH